MLKAEGMDTESQIRLGELSDATRTVKIVNKT